MVIKFYMDIYYIPRYYQALFHISFNPIRAILPTHFIDKNTETQRKDALPKAVTTKIKIRNSKYKATLSAMTDCPLLLELQGT